MKIRNFEWQRTPNWSLDFPWIHRYKENYGEEIWFGFGFLQFRVFVEKKNGF